MENTTNEKEVKLTPAEKEKVEEMRELKVKLTDLTFDYEGKVNEFWREFQKTRGYRNYRLDLMDKKVFEVFGAGLSSRTT